MNITTKGEMYELLYGGSFGNYPRAWRTLDEIKRSGYSGDVSIRSLEISNPIRLYHIPASELDTVLKGLPKNLVFSEAPPDAARVVQGEYDGFNLTYSFYRAPMRIALEKQLLHAEGPQARWVLKRYLPITDIEWLDGLIERFPNHVVEFSTFSCRVGTHRGYTIFWEVRCY